jgi:ribosome modulation factor
MTFANLERARRAGRKAAKAGRPKNDNPFGPGFRPEFHAWNEGWQAMNDRP